MSQLRYNILIPHKNDSKRLQRCLDSIPKRDDLRVIVVDDNSDPAIVDFDHFPGSERDDVEIIFDKVGGGAGHARNIGLKHVNAEKLINADADDFFTYCFNEVLDEYANDESDIVFFNVSSIEEGTYLAARRDKYLNDIINGYFNKDPHYYELRLRYDHGSPCCKIIRRSLLDEHHIEFEEVPIHDDTKFSYLSGHYAKTVKVDKRAVYCISYLPSSVSFTLTEEKYMARMHVIGERDQFVQRLGLKQHFTGIYIKWTLVDIRYAGKKELYRKCLSILEEYGYNSSMMNWQVRRLLLKNMLKRIIKYVAKKLIKSKNRTCIHLEL